MLIKDKTNKNGFSIYSTKSAYLYIVKGHKDDDKYISHSLLTGKLVSRFPTHHQSCKCKRNLTSEMLALENK